MMSIDGTCTALFHNVLGKFIDLSIDGCRVIAKAETSVWFLPLFCFMLISFRRNYISLSIMMLITSSKTSKFFLQMANFLRNVLKLTEDIHYSPKTKLWEGNVFRRVCLFPQNADPSPDTVNRWSVRILLECILVRLKI